MPEAARLGDQHTCPLPKHKGGPIDASRPPKVPNGSPNVETNGLPQARVLDWLTCAGASGKDLIVTGSDSVDINGLPAARKTDETAHGGAIDAGSDDVEIGGNPVRVHLTLKDTKTRVVDNLKAELSEIADCYHKKTGQDLVITDGSRTAAEQAEVMYPNMTSTEFLAPYHAEIAGRPIIAILKAYNDGKTAKLSDAAIKQNMTTVITGQNPYVSDHMTDRGADIATTGVNKKALNDCLDKNGSFTHFEHNASHIHIQKKH
ncbi:MAG: PAAR domain-containing protein [Byssovorax sp.]